MSNVHVMIRLSYYAVGDKYLSPLSRVMLVAVRWRKIDGGGDGGELW
jgi:hypothetical protein